MIPIDLVTGFLGSGKTTFIRRYAAQLIARGLKVGILENDYGAVNVDMMLLQDLPEDSCGLEMVAGGCDADCHRRRFKTKLIAMGMSGYDRVIIEPSGIFDVDEFFDVLHEEPLDRWYEIGNVFAVADAALEDTMSPGAEYLLASQIAEAGAVILSRTQEHDAAVIGNTVEHLNRAMAKVGCPRRFRWTVQNDGDVSLSAAVTGNTGAVSSAAGGNIGSIRKKQDRSLVWTRDWDKLTEEDWEQLLHAGWTPEDFRKLYSDSEEVFGSLYYMNRQPTEDEIREILPKLFRDPACGHVVRVKGFFRSAEGEWREVNATRNSCRIEPIAKGQDVLIVIGEGLNKETVDEYWGV